ncbi:MAG: hypothetical protein CVV44_05600 [Spirochaetae bacterium HGW-Spirochaetae-1]|jgi:hypothetical protein|nr:MAG: hypothetical protein CVV44_05600 [Spirochaetae bacterium HGW-Spirochaetae-1]
MNFLVPVMMWGWIPFTIFLFRRFTIQKAILISVIGGVLFLPVTEYDLPMIEYEKNTAIALSLLGGIIFSGKFSDITFRPGKIDIPIITYCIISPLLSIFANGLGVYNAVAAAVQTSLDWGIFYLAGRMFFTDKVALRHLVGGIIIGGLIYAPLALFEVRMSPQLSIIVYGFFPSSFLQQIRYGGFRPIVFMTHGLMVSLWMAATFTVSFWLFRAKEITEINKIPMILVVLLLLITTVLCKSANGFVFIILGILSYYLCKILKSTMMLKIIILVIPLYLILRVSGVLPTETLIDYLAKIFDAERIESLSVRLFQEEVFGRKALEHPLLGWGWMDFAWPLDPFTGINAVRMIDAYYIIIFGVRGFLGLASLYAVLLSGPWIIMKFKNTYIDAMVLSIIVIFFAIDTLINGMINPVYILIAGALIGFSEKLKLQNDKSRVY